MSMISKLSTKIKRSALKRAQEYMLKNQLQVSCICPTFTYYILLCKSEVNGRGDGLSMQAVLFI